jgi:hypothetical protein
MPAGERTSKFLLLGVRETSSYEAASDPTLCPADSLQLARYMQKGVRTETRAVSMFPLLPIRELISVDLS